MQSTPSQTPEKDVDAPSAVPSQRHHRGLGPILDPEHAEDRFQMDLNRAFHDAQRVADLLVRGAVAKRRQDLCWRAVRDCRDAAGGGVATVGSGP